MMIKILYWYVNCHSQKNLKTGMVKHLSNRNTENRGSKYSNLNPRDVSLKVKSISILKNGHTKYKKKILNVF